MLPREKAWFGQTDVEARCAAVRNLERVAMPERHLFAVIRQAMKEKDVVGIARLVLNRRERATLLEPGGNGIVLWTLC